MVSPPASTSLTINGVSLEIFSSKTLLGRAAAAHAAGIIQQAVEQRGSANIVVATGNSQLDVVYSLTREQNISWRAVTVFHMDEYVGLSASHPSSFRYWIQRKVADVVPAHVHYLAGDAPDLAAEAARYSKLLQEATIDVAFLGFGENGHIAFNDPHSADFDDAETVKRVTLDAVCRAQQVGEGHFKDLASVPTEALTMTCSGLFRAKSWICCVPELRKATAVRDAIEGEISPAIPASLVRLHPNARVYLDCNSASLLSSVQKDDVEPVRV
jgi:glucosamine-6-phosphate deaminase